MVEFFKIYFFKLLFTCQKFVVISWNLVANLWLGRIFQIRWRRGRVEEWIGQNRNRLDYRTRRCQYGVNHLRRWWVSRWDATCTIRKFRSSDTTTTVTNKIIGCIQVRWHIRWFVEILHWIRISIAQAIGDRLVWHWQRRLKIIGRKSWGDVLTRRLMLLLKAANKIIWIQRWLQQTAATSAS